MKTKRTMVLTLILACAMALAACSSEKSPETTQAPTESKEGAFVLSFVGDCTLGSMPEWMRYSYSFTRNKTICFRTKCMTLARLRKHTIGTHLYIFMRMRMYRHTSSNGNCTFVISNAVTRKFYC